MTCLLFHRWSRWETDFEEAPDGDMNVYEWRTRHCKRRNCDLVEEIPKKVSLSPQILLYVQRLREQA